MGGSLWRRVVVVLAVLAALALLPLEVTAVASASPTQTSQDASDLADFDAPAPPPAAPVASSANELVDAPPTPSAEVGDEPEVASSAPADGAVVDPALTTPTQQVYENPDGTFVAELNPAPVRFQDDTGAWVDIDATPTAASDGDVVPASSPADQPTTTITCSATL